VAGRPIAHKYRKGKMQRTLKTKSKELENVESEAVVGTTMVRPQGIWMCASLALNGASAPPPPPLSKIFLERRGEGVSLLHFLMCGLAALFF